MRLQKYLAECGVASRRHAEEMIREGKVTVNGVTVTEMGTQVEEGDRVSVNGKAVRPERVKRYIMYHKPAGEVTTASDPEGRKTVLSHFEHLKERLYPVGRLDYDSEGLLLGQHVYIEPDYGQEVETEQVIALPAYYLIDSDGADSQPVD